MVKRACRLDEGLGIVTSWLKITSYSGGYLSENEEATGIILLRFNIFPFLLFFSSVFSALNPTTALFMTSTCAEMICGHAWFDLPVGCLVFLMEDV